MHDVIVVGAGAAGIAAAFELARKGIKPLILDVGYARPVPPQTVDGNLYDHRERQDTFDLLIGDRLQGLANILGDRQMLVKLTAPAMEYVTRNSEEIAPIDAEGFSAVQSFARGGLANAWGAGLYRFTDRDLDGFPIRESDLLPFFDRLTREIGVSGSDDDLTPFFGSPRDLQPSVRLSHNAGRLYRRYRRLRRRFAPEIRIGRPRTAVLTEPKDGRPGLSYRNLEFWQESPAQYTPRMTLDKLVRDEAVIYRDSVVVESWEECGDGVRIRGRSLDTDAALHFKGRKLLLAAGAINTARIALRTMNDHETRLALLENPALQIPLVLPTSIGRPLDREAFGLVQLNLIWESGGYRALIQGSLMEITSPPRAEFFASLPFSAHANLALLRYLLPAMMVLQLFFPASVQEPARLWLRESGRLRIAGHPNPVELSRLRGLLRVLRRLGAWSHPALVVRVPTGHAVHYAGTLPMRVEPGPYECDAAGKLHGSHNVFIGDSASFPALPAKNMSFTMMANAMRIADHVVEELEARG